jgi:hypothetical protein
MARKPAPSEPGQAGRIPGGIARESYFPIRTYLGDVEDPEPLNTEISMHIKNLCAEMPEVILRSKVRAAGAWHSPADSHRHKRLCSSPNNC